MTKTSLAVKMILFGCAFSVLPTIAVAQASAAIERQWMSLPGDIWTCLQAKLVLSNSSINEKIQEGISPDDPLISKQISDCGRDFDLERDSMERSIQEVIAAQKDCYWIWINSTRIGCPDCRARLEHKQICAVPDEKKHLNY